MCDLSYVLLLGEWQQQAMVDRQALISRGVQEGLPTMASARYRLDEMLCAEPVPPAASLIDDEQMELRRALGVA